MKDIKTLCDLCGKPACNSDRLVTHSDNTEVKVYDLCPNCMVTVNALIQRIQELSGKQVEKEGEVEA